MAMANPSRNAMETECFICSELFMTPKLLPCSHTFCRHCLLSWLTAQQHALCPLCECAIADPGATSMEGVVDSLPTDLAMEALVDSTRFLSKGHACDGCRNNGAVRVCLTCRDVFCQSCANVHENSSATRRHKVEDLSTMTPERLAASQPASCRLHSDKPAELFCPRHDVAICQLCATARHRFCWDVVFIEQRVEELRTRLAEMSIKLWRAESELDNVIRQLDQQLAEVELQGQKTVSDIDADCDRVEKALRDCRRRLKNEALCRIANAKGKIQAVKVTFVERKVGLTTHRVSVDRIKRAMPSKFLSDVNPILQSKMNNLDLSAQLPADMKAVSIPPMTTDREALKHVEREVNNLGLVLAAKMEEWRFNPKHGEAICLSNEGHTAMVRKVSPYAELGRIILTLFRSYIAVASQPMRVNTVYEVKVVAGDKPMLWLTCGALLTPVDDVILPNAARGGWNHAVVFGETVIDRGSIIKHKTKELRDKLYLLQVGSRVGLVIDHARRLHLLVDGSDVIHTADVPSPCFAFFELNESCTKITTLPLRQFDLHQ